MDFFTQHIIYGLWEQVIKMLCSAGEEPLTHLKITCIYNLFFILFPRWISTWRRKNNTGWVCLCLSVHSVFTEQFILCSHDFWVSCFYFTFLSVGLLFLHCIFLWGLFSFFFQMKQSDETFNFFGKSSFFFLFFSEREFLLQVLRPWLEVTRFMVTRSFKGLLTNKALLTEILMLLN